MKRNSGLSVVLLLTVIVALLAPAGIVAQDSPEGCTGGACPEATGTGVSEEVGSVEGMGGYRTYSVHGGYVAIGTGMRNRGYGQLRLSTLPKGAKVTKAFLYWNIVDFYQRDRHKAGTFNGKWIRGEYIGADHSPCWLTSRASAYSYRADVTSLVTGNGRYYLGKFHSGLTDGSDPWVATPKPPLLQGASLVVIFEKSTYPVTRIVIWDGAASIPFEANSKWIQMAIPAAPNPSVVYTTFIGADGQEASEPASTVNYNAVPEADWDGTDWQVAPSYSLGNLWDTDTASVGKFVSPGSTSVRVEVSGSPDCLTWVAQILSISDGSLDSDGDALLDGWEANGHNGIDLPAMGASPWRKDIFVEHDWMAPCASCASHQPSWTVLNRIKASFALAPVGGNPDGSKGITLHNDLGQAPYWGGNQVPHQNDVAGSYATLWTGFDAIKGPNFNANRADIFHYVLWAHDLSPDLGSTSGISRGIPASDLIVSLGSWSSCGTEDARTGTYIHELGHNVGLTHGGNVGDHENYKPNHISVMNYAFQTIGVWRSGARRWDYTRFPIWGLNENSLNEFAGLQAGTPALANYGTRWWTSNENPAACATYGPWDDNTADTNVDWNRSGTITTPVAKDLNRNCQRTFLGAVHDQWANLIYNGGTIGLGAPRSVLGPEIFDEHPCMTYEDFESSQPAGTAP